MSISALQQILAEKLGERDTNRFSGGHLQNLLDKEYSDEGALQDATPEGLQTPPALPPALIHIILKGFGQPGEKYDMCWQAIAVQLSEHTSLFVSFMASLYDILCALCITPVHYPCALPLCIMQAIVSAVC